jgi:uncharacterized protein (UPF0276 family)
LKNLRELVRRIEPSIVSDHLCWGAHRGRYTHDLLPLPYTEQVVAHVTTQIARVQECLGRRILLENVSSYIAYRSSTMPEHEFLARVATEGDCGILLDVNNVYVNARNHGFSAKEYIDALPADRIGQIHLAGHTDKGSYLLDTHVGPVPESVWELYRYAVKRFGTIPTLIEWDDAVPEYDVVAAEASRAAKEEGEVLDAGS